MADNIRLEGLVEFSDGLKEDLKQVKVATQLEARRLTLGIMVRLERMSPVDTGRFRSNWFVGADFIPDDIEEENIDQKKNISSERAAGVVGNLPDSFREINIVNNLPYGPRLNDGWSSQAPKGFVETAVDEEAEGI